MMNPGMKPGAFGAGPKLSEMPMSMPMGGGSAGSPAFMPGPGAMGSGQGSSGSGAAANAASNQQFLKNAQQAHQQNVAQSQANTSAIASKFGIGQSGGPRGQGIVPAASRFGAGRMPMPTGAILSDERSKKRIKELEDVNAQYQAVLGEPTSTAGVLESAYSRPTANTYEYRDPNAPGAASGRQAGPMAQELEGIPGVVTPGPDGMKRVDPARLTMTNASQIGNLTRQREQDRAEIDALKAHLDALGAPDDQLNYAAGYR